MANWTADLSGHKMKKLVQRADQRLHIYEGVWLKCTKISCSRSQAGAAHVLRWSMPMVSLVSLLHLQWNEYSLILLLLSCYNANLGNFTCCQSQRVSLSVGEPSIDFVHRHLLVHVVANPLHEQKCWRRDVNCLLIVRANWLFMCNISLSQAQNVAVSAFFINGCEASRSWCCANWLWPLILL